MWILQNSDMIEFRPILGVASRSIVFEFKKLRNSFKFSWHTENGTKDQILHLSGHLEVILHAHLSFVAFLRISISCALNLNFWTQMTLDYKNNHLFPSLGIFHVFFINFIKFGCDRILRHLESVLRFAVHEVKRSQKSSKFTWHTGDEIKVKILYL